MNNKRLLNPSFSKSKYNNRDYIGKVFGNIEVVDFALDDNGSFAFKCVCLCQKDKMNPQYMIISPSKVINGKRISCGCLANNIKYNDNKYIGEKSGALTVLEILTNNSKTDGVKFRCKCAHCNDEDVIVSARHFVYGRINHVIKTCVKRRNI